MHTVCRLQHDIRLPTRELTTTAILNLIELLQDAHNSVTHLGQSELLADTNPWPAVERHVCPRLGRPRVPARRVEFLRVREGFLGIRGEVVRVDVVAVLEDEG